MSGQENLVALRRRMWPAMRGEALVYCSFHDGRMPDGLNPICTFREREGLTAIVEKRLAVELGIAHEFECAMVTLEVHSSLQAVGFLAVVSAALAKEGIACNAVSAYFHDHLFVPFAQRGQAMEVLSALAREAPDGAAAVDGSNRCAQAS